MLIDQANVARDALSGRVAVVTGAGQGIGKETARILARIGAAVAIAELRETGGATEQEIRAAGGRALYVQTDVSDPASVQRLRQCVLDAFGSADIVVNNAACYTTKPVLEHTVEEWDRVLAVNLRGAFLTTQAFLPAMLERGRGVLITMESAEGMPYLAPYLASKVGLRSLAQSLAQEVGEESGVSVYCFGPGIVDTPGAMGAFGRLAPQYGLSVDEFIAQSGLQLASAELVATGLVGTILYAAEFHGQETSTGPGLTKLGLTAAGEPQARQATATAPAEDGPEAASPAGRHLAAALSLNRRLEAILRANVREYDELPMFQRPIIRRMFRQGTGLKVEDWLASAGAMTRRLERAAAIEPEALAAYIAQLRRLAAFIARQESDARGWIREPEKLRLALEALRERQQTVEALAEALAGL